MNTFKIALLLGIAFSLNAHAEIYKYVDEQGHVTYSNIPKKGARKLELEPLNTVPGGKPQGTSTPANFPKVDSATQKKRDDSRRKILQDELEAEEKQLEDARKALAEGEKVRLGDERNYQKYLDRIQKLKDEVSLHEKNVEALRKELGNTQEAPRRSEPRSESK